MKNLVSLGQVVNQKRDAEIKAAREAGNQAWQKVLEFLKGKLPAVLTGITLRLAFVSAVIPEADSLKVSLAPDKLPRMIVNIGVGSDSLAIMVSEMGLINGFKGERLGIADLQKVHLLRQEIFTAVASGLKAIQPVLVVESAKKTKTKTN